MAMDGPDAAEGPDVDAGADVPYADAGVPDPDADVRDWLVARGADPDRAGAAIAAGRADALASDMVLARADRYSLRELAAHAGVPLDAGVSLFHDLGVAVPDPDMPLFGEADARFVSGLSGAPDHGIARGAELLRVIAGSMDRIAEAAVAIYVQGPEADRRRRTASQLDCARASSGATELALHLGDALGAVFRHHMRQAVARQRVIQEGVTRRELARLAIGFVDLVGSTVLQAGLDIEALGEQVTRFETRAFDVTAAGGGRLVKVIGDEIMVAAADPVAGCNIVSELVQAFTDDGTQPRAGLVFGEVLFRHGDYYGPVVNLAARLVDAAIPGEALVDASVVEAVKDDAGPVFEPAGRRMLKGFDEPVAVWTLAAT
jgi:class 3 adenylate cyclase